jgi:hypothetical protein
MWLASKMWRDVVTVMAAHRRFWDGGGDEGRGFGVGSGLGVSSLPLAGELGVSKEEPRRTCKEHKLGPNLVQGWVPFETRQEQIGRSARDSLIVFEACQQSCMLLYFVVSLRLPISVTGVPIDVSNLYLNLMLNIDLRL